VADALEQMLQLVAEQQAKECVAAAERAAAEVHEVLTATHRSARRRMHENVLEIRQIMRREMNQAQAALETAKRQHAQRCDFALIESGWPKLRAQMLARWRDAGARRVWLDSLARAAQAALPRGQWDVYLPADLASADRDYLTQTIAALAGAAPRFIVDDKASAGVRLCAAGACLDGTLEGILGDPAAIQARLLARLGEQGEP
jgi:hypothetical protein